MEGARPSRLDVRSVLLVAGALVAVGAIVFLAQFVSEEAIRPMCDEESFYRTPGSNRADGCAFLDDVGFALIELVPPAIAAVFAVAGFRAGRQRLVWLGFAVAFFLLLLAAFVEPGDYPWATGRDR